LLLIVSAVTSLINHKESKKEPGLENERKIRLIKKIDEEKQEKVIFFFSFKITFSCLLVFKCASE